MQKFKYFDWPTVIVLVIISIVGLINIFSATFKTTPAEFTQQILFLIIGLVAFLSLSLLNVKFFRLSFVNIVILLVGILVLLLTIALPSTGPKRWINLGVLSVQSSEIAKLCFGIVLPYILVAQKKWSSVAYFFILIVGSVLTIIQPSLGNGITIFTIGGVLFLVNQHKPYNYLALLLLGLANLITGVSVLLPFAFFILLLIKFKPLWLGALVLIICSLALPLSGLLWNNYITEYQKQRIETFLAPSSDPLGAGWQLKQAKQAIQTGGVFGTGYLNSSQINNGFLTYSHTDFAYTSIFSQFGLLRVTMVIALYSFLIYRVLNWQSSHRQGELTKYFVCIMLFLQMLFHILINYGYLPVSGIPWPIISAGGSILLVTFSLLGIAHAWHISFKLQQDVW